MGRSFEIVENKVAEAHFFIQKLDEAGEDGNFWAARFYVSAFVSAARSVTFTLKASISDVAGFKEWYERYETEMKANPLARYFLFARNESQKVGYYPIGGGGSSRDKSKKGYLFYFDDYYPEMREEVPQMDVVTACKEYFKSLLEMIYDCFKVFGPAIDPNQYYTIENLERLGKTVEDIEEEIGLPRGWTKVEGFNDKDRVDAIRKKYSTNSVDAIFIEYFNKDRFGNNWE